ncbi:glycoside hydrolase family 30 beta sandwich domain-containing protein [Microbacter margulisiae]|uniref:Glucuronoarabinoxylan endo-1,4-beta-xylanase n=1 Tax=Microbacter margulisiae TaxID=1350067 RepID=A0A7W5DTV1_9PORP|nr:glycoside hydrolase family 30 beta sandwich domain-containing protein [Microbacter margulisiae]MBB3188128.1 glucuronoarabinoxylan endo-1,4-beta-xylanase [Microbacter margulisiae]
MKTKVLIVIAVCLGLTGCAKEMEQSIPEQYTQDTIKSTAVIDGGTSYQTIDGFGFSSAWCGVLTIAKNNALYDTLGFSLLRIRIDENKYWADEIANAAAAHAVGVKVLGSEWSPPPAWNSNGKSTGGYLLPQYYSNYASWLKDAADSIDLDYVSFQNEPDMGYIDPKGVVSWSADQMLSFLKNYSSIIGKPIVYAESFCFNDAYTDPALNDTSTVGKIAYIGGHIYGGGNYVHQNAINHGKHVWMTEHYIDGQSNIDSCMSIAKEISECMYNQMSAYFWWWVYDNDTNVNLVYHDGTIYKNGYTIGQFAKWVRPGYVRISCTYNPVSNVYITAYRGNNNKIVIVAVNAGGLPVSQTFSCLNLSISDTMNVNRTSSSENMKPEGTVSLVNNAFIYTLPAKSITTFH